MMKEGAIQLLMLFILELEQIFLFEFMDLFNNPSEEEEHCITTMLILVIGDHLVHYKNEKLKQLDKLACSRCKMLSQSYKGRYVYGEN